MFKQNTVLPESFHQASLNAFNHTLAGTQCTAISAVLAVTAAVSDPETWTSSDIDKKRILSQSARGTLHGSHRPNA